MLVIIDCTIDVVAKLLFVLSYYKLFYLRFLNIYDVITVFLSPFLVCCFFLSVETSFHLKNFLL